MKLALIHCHLLKVDHPPPHFDPGVVSSNMERSLASFTGAARTKAYLHSHGPFKTNCSSCTSATEETTKGIVGSQVMHFPFAFPFWVAPLLFVLRAPQALAKKKFLETFGSHTRKSKLKLFEFLISSGQENYWKISGERDTTLY